MTERPETQNAQTFLRSDPLRIATAHVLRSVGYRIVEENAVRIARVKARSIREGDQIVTTVARVLGVQGRKPRSGSPLMKIEYPDGSTETLREDDTVEVLRH